MPFYDLTCPNGHLQLDRYLKLGERPACPTCGEPTSTYWTATRRAIIGDEIDVTIRHGLCFKDGSPRRFTSRDELRRAEKQAGMTNYVRHIDGSPHTSRWI